MDFTPSDRVQDLRERVREFMDEHVMPVEAEAMRALDEEVGPGVAYPAIMVEMRERAKAEGLWNLFLPDEEHGPGLTNWEYGMLCEDMGARRHRGRDGVQLLRAGHRQHGDPGRVRHGRSRRSDGSSRCSTTTSAPASR